MVGCTTISIVLIAKWGGRESYGFEKSIRERKEDC